MTLCRGDRTLPYRLGCVDMGPSLISLQVTTSGSGPRAPRRFLGYSVLPGDVAAGVLHQLALGLPLLVVVVLEQVFQTGLAVFDLVRDPVRHDGGAGDLPGESAVKANSRRLPYGPMVRPPLSRCSARWDTALGGPGHTEPSGRPRQLQRRIVLTCCVFFWHSS